MTATVPRGVLVLGIGNMLALDDGVGCRVVEALAGAGDDTWLPEGSTVVDGGTVGLGLLPLLEVDRPLIVVDAAELGEPPGTVRVLDVDDLRRLLSESRSVQLAGVADLLGAAGLAGALPRLVALVAIQPQEIGTGAELSGRVAAAVPRAVAAVRQLARRFAGPHLSAPDTVGGSPAPADGTG